MVLPVTPDSAALSFLEYMFYPGFDLKVPNTGIDEQRE